MKRFAVAALAGMISVIGVSACANPTDGSAVAQEGSGNLVSSVKKDDAIAAMLPAKIRSKGAFTASINPDVEPVKFVDSNGEITGLNPELLRAAGRVLGVEVKLQKGSFDAMVPGLESKRFDVIASVGDFVERQKKIDFIDYLQAGTAIMASKDFKQDKVVPDDLCGLNVGHVRGSAQQGYLAAAAKKCQASGKPKLEVTPYQEAGAAVLSVKSGQADAFWGDSPQVIYNVKKHPDLYKSLYIEKTAVYGIGVNKENHEFRDALRAALLKLVKDGVYDELLKQWGQEEFGIPDMHINSNIKLGS